LIVLLAASGCHAQPAAQSSGAAVQAGVKLSPEMTRRVELMIRSRARVGSDALLAIGQPTLSEVPGYDQVLVTLTVDGNTSQPIPFLISSDGRTLGQFNKYDISREIKDLISTVGRPARGGPESAPVLIVGYDDLECPYCAQMHATLFPAVLNRYKNQVRVVYRDFPLSEIHPWAMHAAIDANCLGASTATGYWNFVDTVHAHADTMAGTEKTVAAANQALDKLALDEGARQKVDATRLLACVQKQDDTQVKQSVKDAEVDPLRVDSTPILFVNGEKVEGLVPVETLYKVIDRALIAAGQTPPPAPPPAAAQPAASGQAAPDTTRAGS
jgi:protein-disulfide isomerase